MSHCDRDSREIHDVCHGRAEGYAVMLTRAGREEEAVGRYFAGTARGITSTSSQALEGIPRREAYSAMSIRPSGTRHETAIIIKSVVY